MTNLRLLAISSHSEPVVEVLIVLVPFALLAIPIVAALLLNLRDSGWQFRLRTVLALMACVALIATFIGFIVRR